MANAGGTGTSEAGAPASPPAGPSDEIAGAVDAVVDDGGTGSGTGADSPPGSPGVAVRKRIKSFLDLDSDYLVNPDAHYEVFSAEHGVNLRTQRTHHHLKARIKEIDDIPRTQSQTAVGHGKHKKLLGEAMATGICGNNISSSCLYVVALCAEPAGKYAPIALLAICFLLYLFRHIYTEVVSALPVNGGTYNLLLNTTTKGKASIAACLTMLSYVATAVISSTSAMRYVESLEESLPVVWATVALLFFVAVLNLLGITESAGVALSIFIFHLTSLTVLVVACSIKAFSDMPEVTCASLGLALNATDTSAPPCPLGADESMAVLKYNWVHTEPDGGPGLGFYFGYSSALLGISGFESSANYVEQQKPGVFPKTLRNMWLAVTFINPLTGFLAQALMDVDTIGAQGESGALLSLMGSIAAGRWLEVWVIIDAALVLTGAVLSSFVGFTGLVHRMTMDRCLPQVLLVTNQLRGTRHWIIIGFWTLTSCLVIFTGGNVVIMGGVYTLAFLSVMCLFVVGNALLKLRRTSLPTPLRASWKVVIVAFIMMLLGLLGNVLSRDALALQAFFIFGAVFVLPVSVMLNRSSILKLVLQATEGWANAYDGPESPPTDSTRSLPVPPAASRPGLAPVLEAAATGADGETKMLPDGPGATPVDTAVSVPAAAKPEAGGTGAGTGAVGGIVGGDTKDTASANGGGGGGGGGSSEGDGASATDPDSVRVDLPRRRGDGSFSYRAMQAFYGFIRHQIHERAARKLKKLAKKPLIFFTSNDNPPELGTAVGYVLQNEVRKWIKFVRVYKSIEDVPLEWPQVYHTLQQLYPQLRIDYVAYVGRFDPHLVRQVAFDHHVPTTFMFMSSFGDKFPYTFTEMGGLRLIASDTRDETEVDD